MTHNLLTLAAAAAELGINPATLRRQIKRGKFHAVKLGRDWFVTQDEISRYRRDSQRDAPVRVTGTP